MKTRMVLLVSLAVLVAGCAIRLGGGQERTYRTLGLDADGVGAEAVAERIGRANARVVLLSAERDSAWFAAVAEQAELVLSGPGDVGEVAFGFLTPMEPLGDTTVALPVEGWDEPLIVHDALYEVDEPRFLDLLAFYVDETTPVRRAVHAFLSYVATDVMPEASVVVAVRAADPVKADSVARLIRPVFFDAAECVEDEAELPPPAVRIFYGPEVRMRCEAAERLEGGDDAPVVAELVVRR